MRVIMEKRLNKERKSMSLQNQRTAVPNPLMAHEDENILVVRRTELFNDNGTYNVWQGLKEVDFDSYLKIIDSKKEFKPRSRMESDENFKQIIPYLIFQFEDKYFLMQRQAKASETRLQSKYSLGIGGHIREEDVSSANVIEWSKREFEEEVTYSGNYTVEPVGILNDDSNAVGKVHVGFVLILKGDSENIKVNSEHKSGVLLTLEECEKFYDHMETWTQIAFNFIKNKKAQK